MVICVSCFKGSFGVKFLLPCGSALQVAKLLAWAFAILMAYDAGEELKKENTNYP